MYLSFHTLNIYDHLIALILCFMMRSKIIKSAILVITLPFAMSEKKERERKKKVVFKFSPCFICTLLTTVTGALIMPRWLRSCGWLVSFSSQGMLYNYQHPSWLPVSWCFFITSSIITASLWTSALQAMHRRSQRLSLDVPSPQWPWCPRLRFISNLFTRGSVQKVSQECN